MIIAGRRKPACAHSNIPYGLAGLPQINPKLGTLLAFPLMRFFVNPLLFLTFFLIL